MSRWVDISDGVVDRIRVPIERLAALARRDAVGLDEARQQRVVEAACARAVGVVVEAAEAVVLLAGVELIRRQRRLATPPLPKRAVSLPGDDLPAAVRQRARRAEVIRL